MAYTIKIRDIKRDALSLGVRISMAEASNIAGQAYACANEMISDRLNEMARDKKRCWGV